MYDLIFNYFNFFKEINYLSCKKFLGVFFYGITQEQDDTSTSNELYSGQPFAILLCLLAKAKETFVIPFNRRHYLLGEDREDG